MEVLEPQLLELFSKKYSALRIDVVVAVSRPAIEFFERHGSQLWPGARVVYNAFSRGICSSGAASAERQRGRELPGCGRNNGARAAFQPNPRRIVIVSGATDVKEAPSN